MLSLSFGILRHFQPFWIDLQAPKQICPGFQSMYIIGIGNQQS